MPLNCRNFVHQVNGMRIHPNPLQSLPRTLEPVCIIHSLYGARTSGIVSRQTAMLIGLLGTFVESHEVPPMLPPASAALAPGATCSWDWSSPRMLERASPS